jgi:GT2 family glycosyltransferase
VTQPARPAVDVAVVTWNTADLTVRALRHLLDTDQGVDLRVLVRDNASSDGTPDAVERAVPEAEVDRGAENLGFAAGVNTILDRATAPWVLALNSDAWPTPGAIGRMVATATRSARVAAVAPRLERPDGTLEHSTHPFPSLAVAATMAVGGDRWLPRWLRDRMLLEGTWAHDRPRRVDWAVGAALLLRRTALDEIGGFDEGYFMYAEDLAWCWEARRRGWEIAFDPEAVVVHVGNASGAHRYGDRRTRTYLQNTHRWYRAAHGPARSRAYRALGYLGAAREQLAARRRRDPDAAAWWRSIRAVHREAVPDSDTSRP